MSESQLVRLRPWAIASLAVYWPLLLILLHRPLVPMPPELGAFPLDKPVHVALYGTLAGLLAWISWPDDGRARAQVAGWVARRNGAIVGFILVHGLADEWTQPWTGRTFEWADVLCDLLGATLAVLLFHRWACRRMPARS